MTTSHLTAIRKCFGIPEEVASIGFELLTTRDIASFGKFPTGQHGEIESSAGGFVVRFPNHCVLRIEPIASNGNLRKARVRVQSGKDNADAFVILIKLQLRNASQPYFLIPAALYGTNNATRGPQNTHRDALGIGDTTGYGGDPQLTYRARRVIPERRHSPAWHFRADRCALPMVFAAFDGNSVAMGVREISESREKWTYNGLGVWTDAERGDAISISIGSLDWPARIIRHELQTAASMERIPADAGELTTEIFLWREATGDRFTYESALTEWYEHVHERPRPGPPAHEAMRLVAEPLITDGVNPESGYFHMFRDDRGIAPIGTLLSWVGILQIGRPLMRAGRLLADSRYVKVVSDMVNRALPDSFNPASQLFRDVYFGTWQTNNWWPDLGHLAVVNGHACYLLLKMHEDGNALNEWVKYVDRVLRRAAQHQRDDGRLPAGFAPADGSPRSYFGYGGCSFVAPMLILSRLRNDQAMRAIATRALDHYWTEFASMEFPGVDLDCRGAVDCGSSHALIRALVEFHRQTRDDRVLSQLSHALHYVCSYRLGHNTRHLNAPCDWSSCGSEITSTHNIHLDAYGNEIIEDLSYYVAQTRDPHFASRVDDSRAWSRQAFNREHEEYGWGKKGWVTEQFYHTYDHYHHPVGDGAVWRAYFPWAAGSLLHAFVDELL